MSNNQQSIEKTISILNKVSWTAYGDHRATDYLTYIQGQHSDESGLMDHLLGEFLEQVLGFHLNQDLHPQMAAKTTGKRPDYIPDDTHLHPFVFDAKGSDTTDLGQHYDQIAGYMHSRGLRYGVLTNMRDLAIYTLDSYQPEVDYSFSFHQLYQDYKCDPVATLAVPNTQRFLAFVERFQRRALDRTGKVQAIIEACHGTHDAELDLDDLVRRLHRIVAALHEDVRRQHMYPLELYKYMLERQEQIALEIDTIAREIDPHLPERKVKAATLNTVLSAADDTTDGQATDRYLYRVAYFAMTRILLARVWEDIGFIEQTLYDGGFQLWYERLKNQIQRVLNQAFFFANEQYSWLYGVENNYTWYAPSEEVLTDVLYDFSRFDFRHLDADVLGAVYEAYLERTDRKNKGQYYTPRPVVRFVWDRVGFNTPDRIFRFEGGERRPRVILDFCTGSGGFLVEAARRIRDMVLGADFDPDDPANLEAASLDDLVWVMVAIVEGLRGSEITAFAYYLTEVNLLIQLTPVIAAIQKKAPYAVRFGRNYALGVIHQDALKLHDRLQPTLSDHEGNHVPGFARFDERPERDHRYDVIILNGYKRATYNLLKDSTREADYVCSNPPYVGEKGHKELFRYYRENFEYWDEYYQGKMDYFYWFIILGSSKLRDGGRLGYITTSYWPTADGASILRRYILEHAKIVEMIDLGETRVFSDAPGQHNMIFVLERCDDVEARAANRPRLVRVKREFGGKTIEERLTRLFDHVRAHVDIAPSQEFEDGYLSVFWSPVTQAELSEDAWHLSYHPDAETSLQKILSIGEPLSKSLQDIQGVVSRADRVSRATIELLPAQVVKKQRVAIGDGIFVLDQSELDNLSLSSEEMALAKRTYKNAHVTQYVLDTTGEVPEYLLYVDWQTELSKSKTPHLWSHFTKFKYILEGLRDHYGEGYVWYALHRPRDESVLKAENLVTSRRSLRNRFAYENNDWYENSDLTVLAKKEGIPESLKYFLALLNSAALDFWYEYRSKKKGGMREYYSTPLQRVPLRRIRFDPPTNGAIRQAVLDDLRAQLDAGDYETAYATLCRALAAGQEDVVHDRLVELVDQIIALKTNLATYNRYFGTRLTRLEEEDPLPEIDPLAVLQGLPASEQWSVDIHIQNGTLQATQDLFGARDDFYFHRVEENTATSIVLRARGRKAETLTLSGDPALIAYLRTILPTRQGQFWRDVKQTLVPKDTVVYQHEVQRVLQTVMDIRLQIAGRQSVIDQIVLDLYGIADPGERELVLGKIAIRVGEENG